MLINEFKKLMLSKVPLVLMVFIFIIMMFYSYNYNNNIYNQNRFWYHSIEKYDDYEEIMDKIQILEQSLATLDPTLVNYETQSTYIEDSIKVYGFLYENEIEFNDAAQTESYYQYSKDKVNFVLELSMVGLVLLTIVSSVLAILMISYELILVSLNIYILDCQVDTKYCLVNS